MPVIFVNKNLCGSSARLIKHLYQNAGETRSQSKTFTPNSFFGSCFVHRCVVVLEQMNVYSVIQLHAKKSHEMLYFQCYGEHLGKNHIWPEC